MPLIPDKAAFQNSLAGLPLVTYQPGARGAHRVCRTRAYRRRSYKDVAKMDLCYPLEWSIA